MDMQNMIDAISAIATIMAFDILPDGTFSEIRIMAANSYFLTMVAEKNPMSPPFKPGIPYKYYFQDVNFESFGYNCVQRGEILYSCANAYGAWVHGMYLPLVSEQENVRYFCYVLKASQEPDAVSASNHSAQVSSALLNLSFDLHSSENLTQAMVQTAKNLSKICGSRACGIFTVDTVEHTVELFDADGPNPERLAYIAGSVNLSPYETAMMWEKDLAGSDCLILDNLTLIKERDPGWYNALTANGVESIVFYAVRYNQRLVGFLMVTNFDVSNMIRIKETMELTTFFIGATIANHQLVRKLEMMSMTDMLTQVSNRNAMNVRVDQLINGECDLPVPLGVVYADLNGLKAVNDEKGHEAGDQLLIKAAALLRTVFGSYEIYRPGGDEFVILCPEITEDKLAELTALLRQLTAASSEVRFAIGSGFTREISELDQVMKDADQRMYLDKSEYYRQHPEINRRGIR